MSKFFIVGTPIGNLKDITLRALETLQAVDYIACEDTRHSLILLNHYDIKKPLLSVHKFNEKQSAQKVIDLLKKEKNVAYISDAGMPSISDPGLILFNEIKTSGFDVEIVPGVTACITALVGSGLSSEHFLFLGFLPEQLRKRKELIAQIKNINATLIFYVSSHDIEKDLQFLFEQLGNRKCVIARELTKKFEEYICGNLGSIKLQTNKGEFVVLVEGIDSKNELTQLTIDEHFEFYLKKGFSKQECIKQIARDRGVSKSEIYKHFINK